MTPLRFFKKSNISLQAFWKGSTLQLLSVIILPLGLLILVFAAGSTWLHQEEMRMMVGERNQLAARAAASTVASELHHRQSSIEAIALNLANSSASVEQILNTYSFHALDFNQGLAVYSANGNLVYAAQNTSLWADNALIERIVSTSDRDRVIEYWTDDQGSLVFISPTSDQSTFIAGAVKAATFSAPLIANMAASGDNTTVLILNADGGILFNSQPSVFIPTDLTSSPQHNTAGGAVFYKRNGVDHVLAFSPIPELGWTLYIEEPWDSITNPSLTTTQIAPLILIPLLILMLASLWFGARQIVQPLRDLERRTAALMWGDTAPIEEPVGGIAEIRELQDELIHMAKVVQTAQRSLRDYIGVITDAQEDERRRLARELHDETLQSIIALKQRVQMAQKTMPDEVSKSSLSELENLAEDTIKNVRRITRALRPIYLEDLGLVTALEMLAKEQTAATTVKTTFHIIGLERRLSQPAEIAIFRVTQEAISNATRHAKAENMRISIEFKPNSVELEIQDDGVGFDVPNTPGAFAPAGHYGLLGMYERVELIGAKMSIDAKPDQGTRIHLSLPTGS